MSSMGHGSMGMAYAPWDPQDDGRQEGAGHGIKGAVNEDSTWFQERVGGELVKLDIDHWIGLRENLQETMVFTIKYGRFL